MNDTPCSIEFNGIKSVSFCKNALIYVAEDGTEYYERNVEYNPLGLKRIIDPLKIYSAKIFRS